MYFEWKDLKLKFNLKKKVLWKFPERFCFIYPKTCMFFTYICCIKILIYWQLVLWLQIQTGSQVHLCLLPNSVTDLKCIMRQDTYFLIFIKKKKKNNRNNKPTEVALVHVSWELKAKITNTCQEALLFICFCDEVQVYNKISHSVHIKKTHILWLSKFFFSTWKHKKHEKYCGDVPQLFCWDTVTVSDLTL